MAKQIDSSPPGKVQVDSDGDEDTEGWVFKLKVRLQAWAMVFPNDDDEVASQKMILFFFAFLAVPIFGYSMYLWIVLGIEKTYPAGDLVGATTMFAHAINFWSGYVALRLRGGKLSTALTHVYYFALEVLWGILVLAVPDFGIERGSITMTVMIILARPPLIGLHLIVPLCLMSIILANEVFDARVSIPQHREGNKLEHMICALMVWTACGMTLGTVLAKGVSSAAQSRRNRLAVEMCNEVVDLLQSYDTKGVKEILVRYKKDKDADRKLLRSFGRMNANLERYRPHLPNYILMPEEDEEEDTTTLSDEHSLRDEVSSAVLLERSSSNSASSKDGRNLRTGQWRKRKATGAGLLSKESASSLYQRAMDDESGPTPEHSPSNGGSANGSESTPLGTPLSKHAAAARSNAHYAGCITMAELDFLGLSVDRRAEWLPLMVDQIYQQAASCHGSIHSLLGDTLTVTWNATRRVAQGELKATRFLHRVQTAMKEHGVAACGAAFTGSAACESVQSSTGQQAFLVHCPWRDALRLLSSLAARTQHVLIDEATNAVAHYDFDSQAVDQVRFIPPSGAVDDPVPAFLVNERLFRHLPFSSAAVRRPDIDLNHPVYPDSMPSTPLLANFPDSDSRVVSATIYEVVGEAKREDDEWMYQLEGAKDKNTRHGEVTRAFQAMLSGKYGTCASILQGLLENPAAPTANWSGRNADVLLVALRDYSEEFLVTKGLTERGKERLL
jgi:hypothetical protein